MLFFLKKNKKQLHFDTIEKKQQQQIMNHNDTLQYNKNTAQQLHNVTQRDISKETKES